MYMFLPTKNIIPSDLHILDWTFLQIRLVVMIEVMKMELVWGGGKQDG